MQIYTDKEILTDGLTAQKESTNSFNMYANECVHDDLRHTMLRILGEEHNAQVEVFNLMHKRGWYETPAAEDTKIEKTKLKFAQSCK